MSTPAVDEDHVKWLKANSSSVAHETKLFCQLSFQRSRSNFKSSIPATVCQILPYSLSGIWSCTVAPKITEYISLSKSEVCFIHLLKIIFKGQDLRNHTHFSLFKIIAIWLFILVLFHMFYAFVYLHLF